MIKLDRRRSPGRPKSMCLAAPGRLQGLAAKLLLAHRQSSRYEGRLTANGTAVEGVCVTGEAIRPLVPVVGRELSRWQASMAQYLPSRGTWALSRSRYM